MKIRDFAYKTCKKIGIEILSSRLRSLPPGPTPPALWQGLRDLSRDTSILGRIRTYRTRSGLVIRGDVQDVVTRELFLQGDWEPEIRSLMNALLRPGDVMLDIGANIGWHTLTAARIVGEKGRCYAFEPVPSVRSFLEENLRLNKVTHCEVRAEALCDRNGRATMQVVKSHTGISSMLPGDTPADYAVEVASARLDDLLSFDRSVNLIKIYVEGAEFSVLAGMERLLARDHPDLIIEIGDARLRKAGSSAVSLCQHLATLGYRMYPFQADQDGGGLLPATTDPAMLPETFDALFTTRASLPPGVTLL